MSNKFSEDGAVEIYDTAPPQSQKIPTCLQRQIATIMKTKEDAIEIRFGNTALILYTELPLSMWYVLHAIHCRFVNVQKQAGTKDCGLFAIANAVSMAMGEDPLSRDFDQGSLRRHLIESIEEGLMKPFKSSEKFKKWRYSKTTSVPIYCTCRGIEEGRMIECEHCKMWYHKECCNVPSKYFMDSGISWICSMYKHITV